MAERMDWFKFEPLEWIKGNVQLLDQSQKGIYIELIARIWAEKGQLKNDRFLAQKISTEKHVLSDALECFFDLKIMYEKDGFLSVKFIDKQIKAHAFIIEQKRAAGRLGGRPSKKQTKANKNKKENKKEIKETTLTGSKENTHEEKKNEYDFEITNTLDITPLPENIKNLFVQWLAVRIAVHGALPPVAQDKQLEYLIKIPEKFRIESLNKAIRGTWKNINDVSKDKVSGNDETAAFRSTDGRN